jgi:DNA-binding HxlR family transcriptional regulator
MCVAHAGTVDYVPDRPASLTFRDDISTVGAEPSGQSTFGIMTSTTRRTRGTDTPCSIARTLEVLGERWTFLILREALAGVTRFADFRASLGVAPDVLSDRLNTLTSTGVMEKRAYQEPGARARFGYHLTPAGEELRLVLGALQQWGDEYLPLPLGPTAVRRTLGDDRPVHVAYVDDSGAEVPTNDVTFAETAAYPS